MQLVTLISINDIPEFNANQQIGDSEKKIIKSRKSAE